MDSTLSWNNHTDLIMKRLITACYKIRNSQTNMSALSLKVIYYVLFPLGYELWNYIVGQQDAQFHSVQRATTKGGQ